MFILNPVLTAFDRIKLNEVETKWLNNTVRSLRDDRHGSFQIFL